MIFLPEQLTVFFPLGERQIKKGLCIHGKCKYQQVKMFLFCFLSPFSNSLLIVFFIGLQYSPLIFFPDINALLKKDFYFNTNFSMKPC